MSEPRNIVKSNPNKNKKRRRIFVKDRKYSKPDKRYPIYKLDKEVIRKNIHDLDSNDESYVDFNELLDDEDDSINDDLKCMSDDEEEFITNTSNTNFKNLLSDYIGTRTLYTANLKCKGCIKNFICITRDHFSELFLKSMEKSQLTKQQQRNFKNIVDKDIDHLEKRMISDLIVFE